MPAVTDQAELREEVRPDERAEEDRSRRAITQLACVINENYPQRLLGELVV